MFRLALLCLLCLFASHFMFWSGYLNMNSDKKLVLQFFTLLCFALLCFALICFAVLGFAFLCSDLRCLPLLCLPVLCFALLCLGLVSLCLQWHVVDYFSGWQAHHVSTIKTAGSSATRQTTMEHRLSDHHSTQALKPLF